MKAKLNIEMNDIKTYNRTTLNGTKWEIVYDGFMAALYMSGHFSGYTFRTIEEAQAHLDAVDERVSRPMTFSACSIPADYYGVAGRYYGD